MGEQDHPRAFVCEFDDRRDDLLDAGGIGNLAVMHRHIEVGAQEHALTFDVGVIETAKGRH